MRRHIPQAGRAGGQISWVRLVHRRAAFCLAAGVVVLLAAAAPGDVATQPALVQALKSAPPGCMGILHVDVPAVAKQVIAELRAVKDGFPMLDLDKIKALSAKIRTADVFVVLKAADEEPRLLLVLRGGLGARDIEQLAKAVGKKKFALKKLGKGRYQDAAKPSRARVILGDEARDVAKGVIYIGSPRMLTEASVSKLGPAEAAPFAGSSPTWIP